MPKLLSARPPAHAVEEHQVRRLARSAHAPADWVFHARMIVASWDGQRKEHAEGAVRGHTEATTRKELLCPTRL
jgi:hypothetical protein